jgi:hypothetical protein
MVFTLKIDKIIDLVLAANTSYIYCKNRQIIDPILVTNACVCMCVCSRARAYFSLFSGKKYLTKQANKQQYYKTKDSYIAFVVLRLHRQLKVVPDATDERPLRSRRCFHTSSCGLTGGMVRQTTRPAALQLAPCTDSALTVRLRGGSEGLRTREVRFARALHVRSQLRTAIALEPASAGQRHHCPALERTLAVARPCTRVSSHPHCHAPVHPHWPYTHPRAPPRVLPCPRPDLQR